jgi:hypothetical protein
MVNSKLIYSVSKKTPTSALCLSEKCSFTLVNSAFSGCASLEFDVFLSDTGVFLQILFKHCTIIFFLFLLVIHPSISLYGQKVKTEKGEYLMRIETNISEDEVTVKARQFAQINAIENAFGKIIVQGNSTFIQNTTTGQKTETDNTFSFIADSYVNGEWLETLDEKKELITNAQDGSHWIKITVKGKIREMKNLAYTCEIYTLNCPLNNCKTTIFNNGQSFYVYFKSPKDGFISIYFDDPYQNITTRILPYAHTSNNKTVNFAVKADNEYYLFSPKYDYLNDAANIDELELTSKTPLEQYKVYVLYSPEEFDKPLLSDFTKKMLSSYEIDSGYTLPPSLPSEKFQNWQLIMRAKNPEIEMQTIIISVKK